LSNISLKVFSIIELNSIWNFGFIVALLILSLTIFNVLLVIFSNRYIFKPLTDKITDVPELPTSIEIKKKVFRELSDAKERAANESYAKYPNDIFKQIDLERRLNDSYKLPAFQKHTIPPASYHKLMGEGLKNNW